ncbi:hypothetical protein GP486_002294 [Trichoglossum hirsutum]|uniref:Uncharacterized protein n=1 Tax=Trichoglossum hirsutum TaxID=265104 RepID=A0A9P8RS94_9PEZI|nr:hypothetical protein GP486_002294 [Trichoglossum hirsutum]
MANDSKDDVEMSIKQQDDLFRWQLSQKNIKVLNDLSFFMGGVVEDKSNSAKVHTALKKNRVIDAATGALDTGRITKHFANELYVLSVHRQRKLVGLLFWWEEELVRWRLLEEEEAEIRHLLTQEGEREDLMVALKVVEAKKKMLPSVRAQDSSLPSYTRT